MILRTILAVDPGLKVTGFAVLREDRSIVATGEFSFPASEGSDEERIAMYREHYLPLLEDHNPDIVAVEKQEVAVVDPGRDELPAALMKSAGLKTKTRRARYAERRAKARDMVRLRGLAAVLIDRAHEQGRSIMEILPQEAKRGLTGNAKAEKAEMMMYARLLFGIGDQNGHVADAIGIGLAAIQRLKIRQAFGAAAANSAAGG